MGGIFPDLLAIDGTKTLLRSEKSAASFCHPQNNRRNKIIQRNPEESLEIFPQDNPLSASHTSPENHSSEQTHLPSAREQQESKRISAAPAAAVATAARSAAISANVNQITSSEWGILLLRGYRLTDC